MGVFGLPNLFKEVTMATKKVAKAETVEEQLSIVTIDLEKFKAIYGFVPSTIYVAGKEITADNLTIEVDEDQLKEVKDFIVG